MTVYKNPLTEQVACFIERNANTALKPYFDKIGKWETELVATEKLILAGKEADKNQKKKDKLQADIKGNLAITRPIRHSEIYEWLAKRVGVASQLYLATHPNKFTHASTDTKTFSACFGGEGGYVMSDICLLNSQSVTTLSLDIDGNAAALDIGKFLFSRLGNKRLIDFVDENDLSVLREFSNSESEVQAWYDDLKKIHVKRPLSSHKLAKQLYFPVGEGEYHVLSPLYASSLYQAIHTRISDSRFSNSAKAARKAKREKHYSTHITTDYLNVAVQTFGGTKPQNISLLNSGRGGKAHLFSCQPPAWQSSKKPPSSHRNGFWREYERRSWRVVRSLKAYLESVSQRTSTLARRDKRAEYIEELISLLLQYAAEIQSLSDHIGWSEHSKLSQAEQLWLDPYRQDEAFQNQREAKDWQQEIANQFARWLNHKLSSDTLVFSDAEYLEWSSTVTKKLALLKDDLEMMAP
ncbi:MAG: type I-F CRISPR-associated protein Csy1 [Pontibacterium sp.]